MCLPSIHLKKKENLLMQLLITHPTHGSPLHTCTLCKDIPDQNIDKEYDYKHLITVP